MSFFFFFFFLQPSEFYNLQHWEDIFGAIFDKVYVPVIYVTNLQVMLFKLSLLLVICRSRQLIYFPGKAGISPIIIGWRVRSWV